jgi:adenylylsulfate kinase
LTGLPSAGKTTTAKILENELRNRGFRVEVLDGDEIRKNLSPELGFSKADREIHAKRVAYIGRLLSRNGIATIIALISPYRSTREFARQLIGEFVEVWVQCSIETCSKRDAKGLYKNAEAGQIANLTGIQDPYEPPTRPEVIVNTEEETKEECVERILSSLKDLKYID